MGDLKDRITRSTSRPLQLPGRDRCVAESVLGGPTASVDARLILSRSDLESLLDIARSSLTGRVVLNRPGLRVRLFESPSGHRYEVWTFVAAEAVAEQNPIIGPDGSLSVLAER